MMIEASGKRAHLTGKSFFIKKVKIKVESFLKSSFNLSQTCKLVRAKNHYICNINTTYLLFIFIKDWRKALKL